MNTDYRLKHAQRFKEFAGITSIKVCSAPLPMENVQPLNPLLTEIFAPDPQTGLPPDSPRCIC